MAGQFAPMGKRRGLPTGMAAEFYGTMDENKDDQVFWILQAGRPRYFSNRAAAYRNGLTGPG